MKIFCRHSSTPFYSTHTYIYSFNYYVRASNQSRSLNVHTWLSRKRSVWCRFSPTKSEPFNMKTSNHERKSFISSLNINHHFITATKVETQLFNHFQTARSLVEIALKTPNCNLNHPGISHYLIYLILTPLYYLSRSQGLCKIISKWIFYHEFSFYLEFIRGYEMWYLAYISYGDIAHKSRIVHKGFSCKVWRFLL